jgi:hypothetical protein
LRFHAHLLQLVDHFIDNFIPRSVDDPSTNLDALLHAANPEPSWNGALFKILTDLSATAETLVAERGLAEIQIGRFLHRSGTIEFLKEQVANVRAPGHSHSVAILYLLNRDRDGHDNSLTTVRVADNFELY